MPLDVDGIPIAKDVDGEPLGDKLTDIFKVRVCVCVCLNLPYLPPLAGLKWVRFPLIDGLTKGPTLKALSREYSIPTGTTP